MKKQTFRIAAAVLALLMVLSLFPMSALAGEIPGTIQVKVKHEMDDTDVENTFTYSDSYFYGDSYKYNNDLAKLALGLCFAAGSSHDALNAGDRAGETKNWESMMNQCGFQDIESNADMHRKADSNTFGINAARKTIHDKKGAATLIVAAGRSFGYNAEWGGNAYVGASGDHAGFAICRDTEIRFLQQYVKKHKITGRVKLVLAGNSRSAIAANLVGGALDQGKANIGVKVNPHDLFVYTYESPLGAPIADTMKGDYGNIHNIVNPADMVAVVPFYTWGFARYGTDHYLPTKGQKEYEELLPKEEATLAANPADKLVIGNKYWPDAFQAYDATYSNGMLTSVSRTDETQPQFYKDFAKAVNDAFITREEYVSVLEPYVVPLVHDFFDQDKPDATAVLQTLLQNIQANWQNIATSLLNGTSETVLTNVVAKSLRDSNFSTISDADLQKVVHEFSVRGKNFMQKYPGTTVTLLRNIVICFEPHFSSNEYAWAMVTPASFMEQNTGYSYDTLK